MACSVFKDDYYGVGERDGGRKRRPRCTSRPSVYYQQEDKAEMEAGSGKKRRRGLYSEERKWEEELAAETWQRVDMCEVEQAKAAREPILACTV